MLALSFSGFDPKQSMGLARGHHSAIVGFSMLNISQWSTAMPNSQEIEAKSHSPVPQGYVLGA
ncbi:MAG TPA: hypothetical protein VHQ95_24425, partial [Pyrinomonadaceae bacterium]|nr:hypothetical protein [Pyrinomonadaceae bacterium]